MATTTLSDDRVDVSALADAYDRAGRAFIAAAGHCRGAAEQIRRQRWTAAESALGLICDRLAAGMDTLGILDTDRAEERQEPAEWTPEDILRQEG